jgi:hypothetical protein
MKVSGCCDAYVYDETIMDDCGLCSRCKEWCEIWDDEEEEIEP